MMNITVNFIPFLPSSFLAVTNRNRDPLFWTSVAEGADVSPISDSTSTMQLFGQRSGMIDNDSFCDLC